MSSARRYPRAVFAFFVLSVLFCAVGFSQTSRVVRLSADPPLVASLPAPAPACASGSLSSPTDSNASFHVQAGMRGTNIAAVESLPPCDTPSTGSASELPPPMVDPCKPPNAVRTDCDVPADAAQLQLAAMGKPGQTISRAREKVLEILQSSNACSAWFQQKDPNPAATFRTLTFDLDRKGDEYVLEIRDLGPGEVFRSPYVARVMQADGSYATITINARGAFFRAQATIQEVHKEGGPTAFRGERTLRVGPYFGDTLPAQVATLLHEFGHLIDLLPTDRDDLDGKSLHNTDEVLRNCGVAIDALGGRGVFSVAR
jgi:hypothetical protein